MYRGTAHGEEARDAERYIRFYLEMYVDGRFVGGGVEEEKNVYKKPTTSLMAIGTKQQKKI